MKLLLFADLQATDGGEVCFHNPGIRLQDWRVARFLRFLRQLYKEKNCDGLVDLGDMTDDRSAIPVPTIKTLFEHLAQFPEESANIKLIGNHEQFTRNASVDVGALFTPFFTVYSEPAVLDYEKYVLVMAPYPGSHDQLNKWLISTAERYRSKRRILFGHFQVVGSITASGMLMDGIPKETVKLFDLAFLGHIHKPQALTEQAFYVGSPFQQNWGESGEDKRVGILNTDTLKIQWVPVTGFPVYKTVTLAEFLQVADDKSENRYDVILHSSDEAAQLYAHPLGNRVRPRYEYTSPSAGEVAETASTWDAASIMKRYLERNPWEIEITAKDMLNTGLVIANGATDTIDSQLS